MSYIDEIITEELYDKIDELKDQLNSSYEHNKHQRKINQELQETLAREEKKSSKQ